MSIVDLTAPERLLWEAFARGALVDLRPAGSASMILTLRTPGAPRA